MLDRIIAFLRRMFSPVICPECSAEVGETEGCSVCDRYCEDKYDV